ncbi:MAG TPA: hypothetical protein VF461_21995 [Gemmatimonadaceae bacterium]
MLPSATAARRPDADPPSERPAGPDTASLPKELADFLMELAVALHKHAIYPPGHPLLDQAVDSVHVSLTRLLADRPALSIGVARRELIIEGVATDSDHPLLAELAGKLHRHHLGAVKLLPGINRPELSDALAVVGLEAQRDAQPIGLQPELLHSRWTNVKLFPLTYDRLELLDDDGAAAESGSGQAAQLWVGLARAAIASELAAQSEPSAMEPEAVAHAIDEHGREQAYDQVIVGYLLQIAREVRQDGGHEDSGLKRRISRLVGSLQPGTLRRLLEMGGDATQRRRFVLDAAQGMTVDAVVELVQAAATAEGQTISHSLVRMLTKLASHAASDASARSRAADGAFREHVERLVGSWSLDDPNPAQYSAALSHIAHSHAAATQTASNDLACEPARVIGIALELDVTGKRVAHAVTAMLDAGALGELLDLLHAAPEPRGVAATGVWRQIHERDPLPQLLAAPRLDNAAIRRLIAHEGTAAVPALLAALDACGEGSRLERLMSYLLSLGPDAAPLVAEHLTRAAAPLARELLAALVKLAPHSPPVEAGPYLTHFDPTLRREAARLLLGYESTRESTLLTALRDEDERVVYSGLLAAATNCSAEAAALIRQRIDDRDLTDGPARAAGIRAVATRRDDAAHEWVLAHALLPSSLLRKARLAPASPEVLASLTALVTHWADHPSTAPVLELAQRSTSPSVRAAVQREHAPTPPAPDQ